MAERGLYSATSVLTLSLYSPSRATGPIYKPFTISKVQGTEDYSYSDIQMAVKNQQESKKKYIPDSFWSTNKMAGLFDLKILKKNTNKYFPKKILKSKKSNRKYYEKILCASLKREN